MVERVGLLREICKAVRLQQYAHAGGRSSSGTALNPRSVWVTSDGLPKLLTGASMVGGVLWAALTIAGS